MNPVPVLLVTFDRLAYTKRAYESIVRAPGVPIKLFIWDNGSEKDTQIWLRCISANESLFSPTDQLSVIHHVGYNAGLAKAMNWFFELNATEPYVVKVDNDTVLPDNWLADLLETMEYREDMKLGAVSGTALRPNGWTFREWVERAMVTKTFNGHLLHFNDYVCGTGVVINMDMIRSRGLLFEGFPCPIAGWTDYTRIATQEGWKFAFYSKVHLNLLNLKAEHELSGDFPEYDQMMAQMRDEGNRWWTGIGGVEGVKKFIADNGGLRPLQQPKKPLDWTPVDKVMERELGVPKPRFLTHSVDRAEKSTQEYWIDRVQKLGIVRSLFVDTPMKRVNEFTRIHEEILRKEIVGKDVLEVGCGWGRMTGTISRLAKSYVGIDFVPKFVEAAQRSFPGLPFFVADARHIRKYLPDSNQSFDVVLCINCAVPFDYEYDQVLNELKSVLRHGGFMLLLEELWMRKEWSLSEK